MDVHAANSPTDLASIGIDVHALRRRPRVATTSGAGNCHSPQASTLRRAEALARRKCLPREESAHYYRRTSGMEFSLELFIFDCAHALVINIIFIQLPTAKYKLDNG